MICWRDVGPLLHLGEVRQRRCERALGQIREGLHAVEHERQAQSEQQRSLQDFMIGQYPEDRVLSRDQLIALLRRQAVLRRQLQHLGIDRLRLEERHAGLQGQWQTLSIQRQALSRKQARYEALARRLNQQQQRVAQQRDDNENEECLHLRANPL